MNGERYPGAQISAWADNLRLLIEPQCQDCDFAKSSVTRAIARAHKAMRDAPETLPEVQATHEEIILRTFSSDREQPCVGKGVAYHSDTILTSTCQIIPVAQTETALPPKPMLVELPEEHTYA